MCNTVKSLSYFNRYLEIYICNLTLQQVGERFEGCLTVHLPHEMKWNAKLTLQGNFIGIFLARHVSGKCTHRQEH